MTWTPPKLLAHLHGDTLAVFRLFTNTYGGDTGSSVNGGPIWISADSGLISAGSIEAARLKTFADGLLPAHTRDGRARDIFLQLRSMGKASSAAVDTGPA